MLTDRFAEAFKFAEGLHRSQTRKGSQIPYIAHLMAVSGMILEWGGDEETAIAGLLHDAVEDQGGLKTLAEIERRFGPRVAEMVEACSDSVTASKSIKAPWRQRKEAHIAKLQCADKAVALISAADKLHNLTALIADFRRDGSETMNRFNAPVEQIIWYYRGVADALRKHEDALPINRLDETIASFTSMVDRL